jgi:peptidoglycan/LPS O-acetylase OafA/YrhL
MRFKSLDSLRGLAALAVVLHHCLLTLPASAYGRGGLAWLFSATPMRLLVDGPGAVLLFFVLSGFVLAASIEAGLRQSGTAFAYGRFATKRFLRIYPPFAAAILASAGLYLLIQPVPVEGLSPWFNRQSWAYPVTPSLLAGHLLMTDQHQDMSLINVMWSLVHELRISLIFPLVYFALRRRTVVTLLVTAGLSAAANWALSHYALAPLIKTLCGTSQYVVMFAFGALIFLRHRQISDVVARAGPWAPIGLVVAGAWLFFLPRQTPILSLWLTGLAACCYVIAAFASPAAVRLLSGGAPSWLGKVSYSLYLLHLPVLLTLLHLFADKAPLWMLLAATVVGSLLLAGLAYRWIEAPCIAFARRVTQPRVAAEA